MQDSSAKYDQFARRTRPNPPSGGIVEVAAAVVRRSDCVVAVAVAVAEVGEEGEVESSVLRCEVRERPAFFRLVLPSFQDQSPVPSSGEAMELEEDEGG